MARGCDVGDVLRVAVAVVEASVTAHDDIELRPVIHHDVDPAADANDFVRGRRCSRHRGSIQDCLHLPELVVEHTRLLLHIVKGRVVMPSLRRMGSGFVDPGEGLLVFHFKFGDLHPERGEVLLHEEERVVGRVAGQMSLLGCG